MTKYTNRDKYWIQFVLFECPESPVITRNLEIIDVTVDCEQIPRFLNLWLMIAFESDC